jgi:hypothetical protein
MRRFIYLVVTTMFVVAGLGFFAQTKLLAAGAQGPQQVAPMFPLDIYWMRRPF